MFSYQLANTKQMFGFLHWHMNSQEEVMSEVINPRGVLFIWQHLCDSFDLKEALLLSCIVSATGDIYPALQTLTTVFM